MENKKKTAHIAGAIYLLLAVTGMIGIMIIPSSIIVPESGALTLANIAENPVLFKLGILCRFACQVAFIFLVLMLYRLFADVDAFHAVLMVVLVMVSIPFTLALELTQVALLALAVGEPYSTQLDSQTLSGMAQLSTGVFDYGIFLVGYYWGLWLLPFGILVYKSGFIPRIFGILLVISFCAYITDSTVYVLLPGISAAVSNITAIFAAAGEFSILLWLLIAGIRKPAQ
ncbi:MAG: DUF4386 domain-containing protein [Spirochaetota bacterium]